MHALKGLRLLRFWGRIITGQHYRRTFLHCILPVNVGIMLYNLYYAKSSNEGHALTFKQIWIRPRRIDEMMVWSWDLCTLCLLHHMTIIKPLSTQTINITISVKKHHSSSVFEWICACKQLMGSAHGQDGCTRSRRCTSMLCQHIISYVLTNSVLRWLLHVTIMCNGQQHHTIVSIHTKHDDSFSYTPHHSPQLTTWLWCMLTS